MERPAGDARRAPQRWWAGAVRVLAVALGLALLGSAVVVDSPSPAAAAGNVNVSGFVFGPTGAPVSGVTVAAFTSNGSTYSVAGTTSTSATGGYTLNLPSSCRYWLVASKPSDGSLADAMIDTFVHDSALTGQFLTMRSGNVKGTVRTSANVATRQAIVTLSAGDPPSPVPGGSVIPRSDGTFVLHADPGSYRLSAEPPADNALGDVLSADDVFQLANPDSTHTGVTLTLRQPNLTGVVSFPTNPLTPVNEGEVWIQGLDQGNGSYFAAFRTAATGRYRFHVPATGNYRITANPPVGQQSQGAITVVDQSVASTNPASATTRNITLDIPNVSGKVYLSGTTTAVTSAWLTITKQSDPTYQRMTYIDASGNYYARLDTGTYWTRVSGATGVSPYDGVESELEWTLSSVPATNKTVYMAAPTVRGTIRRASTGAALTGAKLKVVGDDGVPYFADASVGSDGRYGLLLDRTRTYQLVGVPPASAGSTLMSAGLTVTVPGSGTLAQDLSLPTAPKVPYTVQRLYTADIGSACDAVGDDFTKREDIPLALSNDGKRLLAVVCDKTSFTLKVRVIDTESGTTVFEGFPAYSDSEGYALSGDGQTVAWTTSSGGSTFSVKIRTIEDPETLNTITVTDPGAWSQQHRIQLSENGKRVLFLTRDGSSNLVLALCEPGLADAVSCSDAPTLRVTSAAASSMRLARDGGTVALYALAQAAVDGSFDGTKANRVVVVDRNGKNLEQRVEYPAALVPPDLDSDGDTVAFVQPDGTSLGIGRRNEATPTTWNTATTLEPLSLGRLAANPNGALGQVLLSGDATQVGVLTTVNDLVRQVPDPSIPDVSTIITYGAQLWIGPVDGSSQATLVSRVLPDGFPVADPLYAGIGVADPVMSEDAKAFAFRAGVAFKTGTPQLGFGPQRVFLGTYGSPPTYLFTDDAEISAKVGSTATLFAWPEADGKNIDYRVTVTPASGGAPVGGTPKTTKLLSTFISGLAVSTAYTVKVESLTPSTLVGDTLTKGFITTATRSSTLNAVVSAGGTVSLSWEMDVLADSYEIVATPTSIGTSGIGPFSTTETSRTISGLPAESQWTFRVKRVSGETKEWVTDPANVTIPALTIGAMTWTVPTNAGVIPVDASISLTVTGEAGRVAAALIEREAAAPLGPARVAGPTSVVTVDLTETAPGTYTGTYDVEGNGRIVSVTGRIGDGAGHTVTKLSSRRALEVEASVLVHLTGTPVAGSTLSLTGTDGTPRSLVTLESSGVQDIVLRGLRTASDGVLELRTVGGMRIANSSPVVTKQGRQAAVTLFAPELVSVVISAKDQSNNPLAGRYLSVTYGEGFASGSTDGSGTFTVAQVPVGASLTVSYEPPTLGEIAATKTVAVTAPSPMAVALTITQRPVYSLSGTVKNAADEVVPYVPVYLDQTGPGGKSRSLSTSTDADGKYRFDSLLGGLTGSLRVLPYGVVPYVGAITLVIGNVVRNVVLPTPKIYKLPVYLKMPKATEPLSLDWRTAVHFGMSGKVNGRLVSPNADLLTLPDGMKGGLLRIAGIGGEEVELCFDGREALEGKACGTLVLPENVPVSGYLDTMTVQLPEHATITGTLKLGGVDYTGPYSMRVENAAGKIVRYVYGTGPTIREPIEERGTLRAVVDAAEDGAPTVSTTFFVAEDDNGTIPLGNLTLASAGRFSGDGNTMVPDRAAVPLGGTVGLRASWKNGGDAITGAEARIIIPPGTALVANSVMVGTTPIADGAITTTGALTATRTASFPLGLTVAAGGAGSIRYALSVAADTTVPAVSTRVEIGKASTFTVLPSAYVPVLGLTIVAPSEVSSRTFDVRGRAEAGAVVEVMYSGGAIGRAVASSAGAWSVNITLPDRPSGTTFPIYARSTVDSVTRQSETVSIKYDTSKPEATAVCVRQKDDARPDGRRYCFDPRAGVAAFPFVFVPGQPFQVEVFVNVPERVDAITVWVGDDSAEAVKGTIPGPGIGAGAPTGAQTGWVAEITSLSLRGDIGLDITSRRIRVDAPERPLTIAEQAAYSPIPTSSLDVEAPTNVIVNDQAVSMGFRGSLSGKGQTIPSETKITITAAAPPTAAELAEMNRLGVHGWGFEISEPRTVTRNGEQWLAVTIKSKFPKSVLTSGQQPAAASPISPRGGPTDPLVKFVADVIEHYFKLGAGANDLVQAMTAGPKYEAWASALELVCPENPDRAEFEAIVDRRLNQLALMDFVNSLVALVSVPVGAGLEYIGGFVLWYIPWAISGMLDAKNEADVAAFRVAILESNLQEGHCDFKPKPKKKQWVRWVAGPRWIYDPSGYVYEGVPSLRLTGATATLLEAEPLGDGTCVEDMPWVVSDMAPYDQVNPLITDEEGRYGWDVPEGCWKVQFTKDGYQTAYSKALKVLPPHLDVNVPMVALGKPDVVGAEREASGAYVLIFNRPMDVLTTAEQISLELRTGGDPIPATVEAANGGVDSNGRTIATKFRVTPTTQLTVGVAYRLRVGQDSTDSAAREMASTVTVDIGNLPTLPSDVGVWPAEKAAYVDWTAPADGGSPVTKYVARAWATRTGGTTPVATCESVTPSCTITGLKNGKAYYVDVVAETAVTTVVSAPRILVKPKKALIPIAKPVVSGTFTVGNKLTASLGTWSPLPSGYKFQWLRNGKAIKGATKATYTLAAADLGKVVSVTVTGSKAKYAPGARVSAPSTLVVAGTLSLTPTPAITGIAKKGVTLKAVAGKWGPAPVTLKYQWLRDGVPIAKATKSSYKLVAADVGHVITVQVTGVKAGYSSVAFVSAATATVAL